MAAKRALPEFLQVPWSIKDAVILMAVWWGAQIVLALVLVWLAPVLPAVKSFMDAVNNGSVGPNFSLDLLDAVIGLGVVAWYLRRYELGWAAVGWRRTGLLRAALFVAVGLALFIFVIGVVLALVAALAPGFNANQPQSNEFTNTAGSNHNIALIALVLLPPVLEETIFRGFIFPAISKRTGVVWGAIWSSALFGLAHLQANVSVYTFGLGLVLCFMYVKLKSIIPGMFVHMLNNYLAFVALTSK